MRLTHPTTVCDLPDGLPRHSGVNSLRAKFFIFPFGRNSNTPSHPVPIEGRFAIVTDVRRDAVDADGAEDEGA